MLCPFRRCQVASGLLSTALLLAAVSAQCAEWKPQTVVSIQGEQFLINGKPTCEGVTWKPASGGEYKIEGLLMNARLVQGIFDDLNPDTRDRWAYPDTGKWDADRNTDEFVEAMADWRAHGLIGFTINLQGGSPEGYSKGQPWHNSAIAADGSLRDDYMARLTRILKRADELGMVAILGYYYFGQDQRVSDEAAVIRSVENATTWVLEQGFRNVIIEINNECNVRAYDHDILKPDRVHELIDRAKAITHDGRRLYVSTSYGGGTIPGAGLQDRVVHWDYGNHLGANTPSQERDMVLSTEGAAKRFGIAADVLFNVQAPGRLDAAAANFVAVSQRLGPDLRLYYACAGPMEVPWRMLSAVRNHDASKLQYIVCVSHSNWNENHNDTEALAHQWNDMVADFPEVKFHRISDQNTCDGPKGEGNDFYSARDKWDWLCKSENADLAWICTRNFKSGFDASDAGMYLYIVSGEAAKNKDRHVGGPQTSRPRHSYCATVQQCRWLFEMYTPPKDMSLSPTR